MFNGLTPSSKFKVPDGWLNVQRPPVSTKIKDLEP